MGKKTLIICTASILVLTLVIGTTTAASGDAAVDARLARLESDSFQLRSQLDQIQSEIYRLSGSQNYRVDQPPISVAPLPSRSSRLSTGRSEPMFERLATLVIELKERVTTLENKVNRLNKKFQ